MDELKGRLTREDLVRMFVPLYPELTPGRLVQRLWKLKLAGLIAPAKGANNADLYCERDAEVVGRLLELESQKVPTARAIEALKRSSEPYQLAALARPHLIAIIGKLQEEGSRQASVLMQALMKMSHYVNAPAWKRALWALRPELSPLWESFQALLNFAHAEGGGEDRCSHS